MTTNQSQQKYMAIAIVVIIALLGINGFLWYSKITQKNLLENQRETLIESEQVQATLEKDYYTALSELEELKTANGQLNEIIDGQKEELKMQKARVQQLISNEQDLELARAELSKLNQMRKDYVAQIQRLQEENAQLAASNQQLSAEKETLVQTVAEERQVNEELRSETETLSNQNRALQLEREKLNETVTKASVVSVDDIIVNGYRVKNNGKEALTKRANKAEGIKICFEAQENNVAESGEERFYVRVVDPIGETMSLQEMGSGVITNAMDEQVRFTQYRDVEYANFPVDACMNWQPGMAFKPGLYLVEVYNKGHLAGSSTFKLK